MQPETSAGIHTPRVAEEAAFDLMEASRRVIRIGATYDFEVRDFTIAPVLNLDFVDGEGIWVYGVNIGKGF